MLIPTLAFLCLVAPPGAAQSDKVFRVGILSNVPLSSPQRAPVWGAFVEGLRDLGYVEDLIVDDEAWIARYLVVDIGNVITGRRILGAVEWIASLDWDSRTAQLALTLREIREGPEFDPRAPVNRDYEDRLYDFYGRPKYWAT